MIPDNIKEQCIFTLARWEDISWAYKNTKATYYLINMKTENQKRYIGSTVNLSQRIFDHRRALCNNADKANKLLQEAFNSYGIEAFAVFVAKIESEDMVRMYEDYLLGVLPQEELYNKKLYTRKDIPNVSNDIREKFFSKFTLSHDGCWFGPRQYWIGKRNYNSHALAFVLMMRDKFPNYQIPYHKVLRHTCKNDTYSKCPCSNPDHMILGSFQENINDQKLNGSHSGQKVTEDQVHTMRADLREGRIRGYEDLLSIAESLQITVGHVQDILRNDVWFDELYVAPYRIPYKKVKNSVSKYYGVSKTKNAKPNTRMWTVYVNVKGKVRYGGSYFTEEEAALGYNKFILNNRLDYPLNYTEQ